MESQSVGSAVRQARQACGWSQEAVGRAAGLPQSHVAKIENGVDVRASTLLRVLRVLGYDLEMRPNVRGLFLNPPHASRIAAARDFGIDLGQMYEGLSMRPAERLDVAANHANGLLDLLQ